MEKAGHIHDYGMIRVIEVFRICYIGFMLPMGKSAPLPPLPATKKVPAERPETLLPR